MSENICAESNSVSQGYYAGTKLINIRNYKNTKVEKIYAPEINNSETFKYVDGQYNSKVDLENKLVIESSENKINSEIKKNDSLKSPEYIDEQHITKIDLENKVIIENREIKINREIEKSPLSKSLKSEEKSLIVDKNNFLNSLAQLSPVSNKNTEPYVSLNKSNNFYIGYEIGVSKVNVPNSIGDYTLTDIVNTHDNSRMFIGINFNESIGFEAGHFQGGRYAATINNTQYASSFNLFDLSLIVRPLSNKNIFFLGGVSYGEDTGSGTRDPYKGSGTLAGIGYEIPFYSNKIRIVYKKYYSPASDSYDFASYNVGVIIPFDNSKSVDFSMPNNDRLSIGLVFSNWQYTEPDVMTDKGTLSGVLLKYKLIDNNSNSLIADLRYSYGLSNYSADDGYTGYGGAQRLMDFRLIKNNILGGFNINLPYLFSGIGYRRLDDDSRGLTSNGYAGYRRTSQYYYIPIGIEKPLEISNNDVTGIIEYDYFISGKQKSYMSDTQLYSYDVENSQSTGYGIRGSLSFKKNGWIIMPFAEYWSINKSNVLSEGWCEPKNNTKEFGLKIFKTF